LFKVLVVGDMGTGKTAVIRRYVNHVYSEGYKATVRVLFVFCYLFNLTPFFYQIGVDFALKEINWDSKTLVRLQLWDIAGKQSVLFFFRVQMFASFFRCTLPSPTRFCA
jgi:Ras-related protein Rab-32